ncbi:MAG: Holliday junction resolvase RuvX [Candidatus Eremiobacteraeota bacterium]|nr:Holliday junction resolvase RuvX [Candidatus Eremiobacteraeota bacterium]MCW5868229.1 Holliday junction resolvase RuvX [Candidatus Eremiobacteraeota bacterium]
MRILAVDFGRKRLGLALSDPTGTVAAPLPAIQRQGEAWWNELLELIQAQQVGEIVVGLPRNMDGSYGPAAAICRKFAHELAGRCGLKPYLLDERLTSKAASNTLREGGLSERQQRGKLDSVAASLLLQVYLQRRGTSPPGEKPAP